MAIFQKIDDKFWHNIVGLIIAGLTTLLVWYFTPLWPFFSALIGFSMGTFAGWVKEKLDQRKTKRFNKEDFIATAWGSLIGAVITCVILLNI